MSDDLGLPPRRSSRLQQQQQQKNSSSATPKKKTGTTSESLPTVEVLLRRVRGDIDVPRLLGGGGATFSRFAGPPIADAPSDSPMDSTTASTRRDLNVGEGAKKRETSSKRRETSLSDTENSDYHRSRGITVEKMTKPDSSILSLYRDLKTEWTRKPQNLQKCGQLLDKLKVALIKFSYLPTGDPSSQEEMMLARDVLEISLEYSVVTKDIPAFERYISQLKCYYYDYKSVLQESQNMYKLLGLNLLYLLSVNRVSEFHTELELLPAKVIQANKFIQPVLALEQYIMEGRYNKIFQAKNSAPADSYNFFMDILLETVRDEIGACLEKSYEKISATEAAKRLNLKTIDEVKAFGKKRNWQLGSDNIYYFVTKSAKPKEPLPSVELAEQAIFYARELEMIV